MILCRKKKMLNRIREAAYLELERDKKYLGSFGDDFFTCDTCGRARKCYWAYDLYNTGGDCIWLK
jgi:hypothetical protein